GAHDRVDEVGIVDAVGDGLGERLADALEDVAVRRGHCRLPPASAQVSAVKNRCQRGALCAAGSRETATEGTRPAIRSRLTQPKYRESLLLSRLSPITK